MSTKIALYKTKKFSCYSLVPETKKLVLVQQVEDYTQDIFVKTLRKRKNVRIVLDPEKILGEPNAVQISDFEFINWDDVLDNNIKQQASSYVIRKGLSRKAQFATHLRRYTAKHPDSILHTAVPQTCVVDTWAAFETSNKLSFGNNLYANPFGDNSDVLMGSIPLLDRVYLAVEEGSDVRTMMGADRDREVREAKAQEKQKLGSSSSSSSSGSAAGDGEKVEDMWIMKPSVTNKGMDISLVGGYDEMVRTLVATPDIREWVVQRYIARPLLSYGKKFHLRVYVLCVGALKVYVFGGILMLIAAHEYTYDPRQGNGTAENTSSLQDIYQHLSNTARCVEDDSFVEADNVKLLEDLVDVLASEHGVDRPGGFVTSRRDAEEVVEDIRSQINEITGELFAAFENEYTVFCPMEHCFELYGLDFMVEPVAPTATHPDRKTRVTILEVNPGPDFKQTGERLKLVIESLIEQTCRLVIDEDSRDVIKDKSTAKSGRFTEVYRKEWSVSKLQCGMTLQ